MKKIAILQSNYIPWKGVFDMMNMVDEFVFFEDVDYTKRDWRSRNRIITPQGTIWLTVPVQKCPRGTKIMDVQVASDQAWQMNHYQTIKTNYHKAPFYNEYEPLLKELYLEHTWTGLSEMNIYMNKRIAEVLGMKTSFVNSKDLHTEGTKDDKLIEICQKLGATHYLSGPAAKDYIVNDKFKNSGIGLSYIQYDGYPEYEQLFGEFEPYVSVLDVLFNCGAKAGKYIFVGHEEVVL